jgi:hypothetical protein
LSSAGKWSGASAVEISCALEVAIATD